MNEEKNNEQRSSCEININAKGQFSGKIKSYGDTIDEAMTSALCKATELEMIIGEKNGLTK